MSDGSVEPGVTMPNVGSTWSFSEKTYRPTSAKKNAGTEIQMMLRIVST